MNDHFHRPKRRIIQKIMEASGENPEETISQNDLDRRSELEALLDAFRAMNLDPQALELRLCDQDPPDGQTYDETGKLLIGWEVTGIYDQDVEKINAEAQRIKDTNPDEDIIKHMVYREWEEEELESEIASRIIVKDGKIGIVRATRSDWNFAYVNLLIISDEPIITREMVGAMRGRFNDIKTNEIREVYFLLSYHPDIKGYPCIRLR